VYQAKRNKFQIFPQKTKESQYQAIQEDLLSLHLVRLELVLQRGLSKGFSS
jgi:hypothetical protein